LRNWQEFREITCNTNFPFMVIGSNLTESKNMNLFSPEQSNKNEFGFIRVKSAKINKNTIKSIKLLYLL